MQPHHFKIHFCNKPNSKLNTVQVFELILETLMTHNLVIENPTLILKRKYDYSIKYY